MRPPQLPASTRSRSMVALVVSLTAALILGLWSYLPGALGTDSGVQEVTPGLLTVAPGALGTVTLGSNRTVSLDSDGLTFRNGSDLLFRTVRTGSFLSAYRGSVVGSGNSRREVVTASASQLTIEAVRIGLGEVVYSGRLSGDEFSVPVTIAVILDHGWVRTTVKAPGADAIVIHGATSMDPSGLAPQLPRRNYSRAAVWVPAAVGNDPLWSASPGIRIALGPGGSNRAADFRMVGLSDMHIWSATAQLSITSWIDRNLTGVPR